MYRTEVNMADKLSKEERVLRMVKRVLTDIAKDTFTRPGHRHPLSDNTVKGMRDCLALISVHVNQNWPKPLTGPWTSARVSSMSQQIPSPFHSISQQTKRNRRYLGSLLPHFVIPQSQEQACSCKAPTRQRRICNPLLHYPTSGSTSSSLFLPSLFAPPVIL